MSSRKSRVSIMLGQTAEQFFGNKTTGLEFLGSKKYPGDAFGAAFLSILVSAGIALIFWAVSSQVSPEKEKQNKWGPLGILIAGGVLCLIFLAIGFKNVSS